MTKPASQSRDAALSPAVHEHRLRVRYAETDQMRVVHHANYLLYLEDSRTRLMAERGVGYAEFERRGWALPVRRCELRFRASAVYDEELLVRTHVAKFGAASLTFESEVLRASDGTLLASGSIELACLDLRSGERKLAPLPEELRTLLARDTRAS